MATLDAVVQEGLLVDRRWLQNHGFNRSAVDYFLRSGKLEAMVHGVYRKPGPALKWQHVVYSLFGLGYRVHVGHLSALGFHGFKHYLELGSNVEVRLYSAKKLPRWIHDIRMPSKFVELVRNPFNDFSLGIESVPFETRDRQIKYASPERAFLELASTVSSREEIRVAQLMMEAAANLKPALLQSLLEDCQQVKTKRLFLWMAREQGHPWYRLLNQTGIDLGAGKRQIVKGGVLDREFLVTIPEKQGHGQNKPLF